MTIKLLQLNIYKGNFLKELISFVQQENFDILHLQEVYSGNVIFDDVDKSLVGINCFKRLTNTLGYKGELTNIVELATPDGKYFSMGNATLFKPSLPLHKDAIVWLRPFQKYTTLDKPRVEEYPRNALILRLTNQHPLLFINTHLAWSKTSDDTPEKLQQAEILFSYIKSLKTPFVLTGDFNVSLSSEIIKHLNQLARNLTLEYEITNTLNPSIHKAKDVFPKGLVVDFAYASASVLITDFRLIDTPTLSDHFGYSLTLEV
ncbi:MAG: hypothetical protein HYT10_01810 [Candidatus Levybacteria bacterium]|nr:hypothetical protein [Candidatus Levybacteria bacterium]